MTKKDKRRLKQTGERIKATRKKLGLTMEEFGKPIGAKPSAISTGSAACIILAIKLCWR